MQHQGVHGGQLAHPRTAADDLFDDLQMITVAPHGAADHGVRVLVGQHHRGQRGEVVPHVVGRLFG